MEISVIKNFHIFFWRIPIEWDHPHSERWHLGWWFDESCATGARRSSVRAGCFQHPVQKFRFFPTGHSWLECIGAEKISWKQTIWWRSLFSAKRYELVWWRPADGDRHHRRQPSRQDRHLERQQQDGGIRRCPTTQNFLLNSKEKWKLKFPPSR